MTNPNPYTLENDPTYLAILDALYDATYGKLAIVIGYTHQGTPIVEALA